jgi:hypothetical protein
MPSTPSAYPQVNQVFQPGSIPGSFTRASWAGPKALASFLFINICRRDSLDDVASVTA